MRRGVLLIVGWILGVAWAGPSQAMPNDGIFVCVDSEGHKTYQNSADGPSCRRVDGVVATIPSSDLPRGQSPRPGARAGITPASFPRVDTSTQRARDTDRRHILEDELRFEQDRLVHLQVEFNKGQPQPAGNETIGSVGYHDHVQRLFDDIERSESNIASLKRELTPFRY
jgi:hypothetical protein